MSKSLLPDIESSTSSRFSLILLEPDEIYFEDYLVYYNELKCPFNSNNDSDTVNFNQLKGNLKICSKSFVFDPINLNYPLVKFPYKSIEKIIKFDEYEYENDKLIREDEDIYSTNNKMSLFGTNSSVTSLNKNELNQLKKKTFAINSKQIIKCKANNKIGPYNIVKRDKPNDLHYFQFIFTNVNDSLDLLCQLHRASTLEYEQEDLMLQLILKSRLSRNVEFDVHQLDDMFKEQIQFESIVNKINPLVANPGRIILTNMCLYYKPFNNLDNEQKLLKIKLKQIKYVIKRRYHLKKIGCEIVFNNKLTTNKLSFDDSWDSSSSNSNMTNANKTHNNDRKSLPYLYLTFEDEQTRDKFFDKLVIDQRDKLVNLDEFNQENMLQVYFFIIMLNCYFLI
jgi:factor associated with neutral sphingomyelinase activation